MSTNDPAHVPASASAVPVYQAYMNPILDALRSAGRPLLIEELDELLLASLVLQPRSRASPMTQRNQGEAR